MKFKSISSILLPAILAINQIGCTSIPSSSPERHGLEEVDGHNLIRQYVGPAEKVESYTPSRSGRRLTWWNIVNNGQIKGIRGGGRTYGLNFVEIATDRKYLQGNVKTLREAPTNLQSGCTPHKRD
jgi:hypothetical protein